MQFHCVYVFSLQGLTVLGAECITRCVQLSREDMVTFMTYDNPFFDKMSTKAREDLKLFCKCFSSDGVMLLQCRLDKNLISE